MRTVITMITSMTVDSALINNQGKVRSDNIASRQHDGLLFRSAPEINLYCALKDLGLMSLRCPSFCAVARRTSGSSQIS